MEARIFNNVMTPISLRPFKIIDGTFLDQENFKKIKIKNLFELFVSRNSLGLHLNAIVPDDKYKILKKAAINWKNRYTNIYARQNSEDFQHFCNRYKKGSRIFKNHFKEISKEYVPHNIIKYSENTDTVIAVKESCALNKLWTLNPSVPDRTVL